MNKVAENKIANLEKKLAERNRKLEIEAALEKVRAASMAMRKSEELQEVIQVVCEQLIALGIKLDSTLFVDVLENGSWNVWNTTPTQTYPAQINIPFIRIPPMTSVNKAKAQGKKELMLVLSKKEKDQFLSYFFSGTNARNIPVARKKYVLNSPGHALSFFFMKNIILGITTLSGIPFSEEENAIFRRFKKVFEQAYIRFLDLQKAEAQAREAQIEAALERIRAQSMAMHKSEELVQVVKLIDKEIAGLGIMVDNSNIITDISEPGQGVNNWIAIKGQNYLEKFHIPYLEHPVTTKFYHAIKKGVNYYSDKYSKSDKDKYFKLLFKYSDFRKAPKKRQQFVFSAPGWTRALVLSKNSALMFQRHNITDFTVEEEEIFKRFGKVFEQAYTRFLDLQKAEEQARQAKIEAALERVRARSMGMHKSNELKDVVRLLYKEFRILVTDSHSVNIQLKLDSSKDIYYWASVEEDIYQELYHLPDTGLPLLAKIHNAFTAPGDGFVDYLLNKEEKDAFFRGIFKIQPVPPHRKKMIQNAEGMVMMGWFHKHSGIDIMRYNLKRFSEQEKDIVKRFAGTFEQTYIRFLDLQKAEAQAREAQIEAALERVRSHSLAMHGSRDLHGVVTLVYEQLEAIGLFMNSVLLHELTYDSKSQHFWVAANGQVYPEQTEIPITKNAFFSRFRVAKENNESFFVQRLSKQQKDNFFKHYFGQSSHSDVPRDRKDYIFSCDGLNRSTALHEYTALTILRYDKIAYSPEQNEVIRRFAQVFEQSYRRYLDLKKAEEQAREAEIQLALERVRARTMAMYNSDELAETAAILFQQMTALGVTPERLNICLINEADKVLEVWATDQEGTKISHHFNASLDEPTTGKRVYDAWKEKKKSIVIDLSGKELNDWIRYVRDVMGMTIKAELVREHRIHSVSFFSQGLILTTTSEPLPAESIKLLERFADVFNLTYRRFLDLQKAEAQARESQIEAALERVRSRSIGMQHTSELQEIVNIVALELHKMELDITGVFLVINNNEIDKQFTFWGSSGVTETYAKKAAIPFLDRPIYTVLAEATTKGERFFTEEYSREDKIEFFNHLFKYPPYSSSSPEWKNQVLSREGGYTRSVSVFHYTSIFVVNHFGRKLSDADNDILKRFSYVFEQTYTRFLDLQRAETQAREAIKQASLDRVRGEIASMRNSEDLNRITPVIWRELKSLEVPFIRCGVFIINEANETVGVFLTTPDGKALGVLHLAFEANNLTSNTVKSWRKKEVYKDHWNKEEFINWTRSMMKLGQVQSPETYQGSAQPPESLDLHFVPFAQGMLYVGNVAPLDEEKLALVKTLAEAFSIAYARYEDFKNLEEAKAKVDHTLSELQATQKQLIQSEKMASLGELTAGIAHEIQNPLNFVNNFSDVNKELIEELKSQKSKLKSEEVDELLNDISANEEKINHHGKRADAIVKGMLQHSRISTGQKGPTDINALCDEYLRLSYHGLRAKDKTFNADFKTDFDNSIGKINIVPQDIGRVLLNLFNNAFYAVNEKLKAQSSQLAAYSPLVSVQTKKQNDKVEIIVGDNGNGIPDSIKEKIFQPFFTTKPTGSGTGLGLSLSYDIVKAHGGELKAETFFAGEAQYAEKEKTGSTFTIYLPNA